MAELSLEQRQHVLDNWDKLTPENQKRATEQLGIQPPSKLMPPSAETPATPESRLAPSDPRLVSPWYKRLIDQYASGRSGLPTSYFDIPEEEGREAEKELGKNVGQTVGRYAFELGPPLLAAAHIPAQAPSQALQNLSPLYRAFLQYGYVPAKAATVGIMQYLGTKAANLVDPSHATDPEASGMITGATEGIFGAAGAGYKTAKDFAGRHFQESPEGTQLRTTVEQYGGQTQPGMTTKSPFLRGTTNFLEHRPGSGRLRNVREHAQQVIDDALTYVRSKLPGGEVSSYVEGGTPTVTPKTTLDLEPMLRPQLPVVPKTRNDMFTKLRRYITPGLSDDIHEVPRLVQEKINGNKRTGTVGELELFKQDAARGYEALDDALQRTPLSATTLKASLRDLTPPAGTQRGSVFHIADDLTQAIKTLPNDMTLDTAQDFQKMLLRAIDEAQAAIADRGVSTAQAPMPLTSLTRDIQQRVLPALGNALRDVNKMLESKLVGITYVKQGAKDIISAHDQSLLKGQPGIANVPTEEPAHVFAARKILAEPNMYVPFQRAHQMGSELAAISRTPGQNVHNPVAEAGARLEQIVFHSMQHTAENLGQGRARQLWLDADRFYQQGAAIWNSPLMTQLTGASLDDILTTIVRNERPNDTTMLRQVLGEPLWDRVGDMWITRILEESRDPVTKAIRPQVALDTMQKLTPWGEAAVFPTRRMDRVQADLAHVASLEEGLTSTDATRLKELRARAGVGDWQDVSDIRVSEIVERNRVNGVVHPDGVLRDLNALEATGAAEHLWPQGLGSLKAKLAQASAAHKTLTETNELLMRQWVSDAGPVASREAGDVRIAKLAEEARDSQGRINPRTWLDSINQMGAATEQELYGQRLAPLKRRLQQLDAMERATGSETLGNPTLMRHLRQSVNDPQAWEHVQGDLLADGFKIVDGHIDGNYLLNHIDNVLGKQGGMLAEIFPNPQVVHELRHLASAAKAVAQHNESYRASGIGRHPFPAVVEFTGTGALLVFGHPWVAVGVQGGAFLGVSALSRLLTNPNFARKMTAGFHTSQATRQAFDIAGAITGALIAEGFAPADEVQTSPSLEQGVPLPQPGD